MRRPRVRRERTLPFAADVLEIRSLLSAGAAGAVSTAISTAAVPNIGGAWFFNGQATSIVESGTTLTFTNQLGQTSTGQFLPSGTQVETGGSNNLIGTLANDNTEIDFSDGTVWTLAPTVTVPNIAGNWMINGQTATIAENGAALTFTSPLGQISGGQFLSSGTQIFTGAPNNLVGTLTNGNTQIDWSDGTVWTLAPSGNVPSIAGNWMINGQATTVAQNGAGLTFTNERGNVALGEFLSTNGEIMANGWHNLVGNLTNGNTEIDWSNGTIWTLAPSGNVANIAGNWFINGQATTIAQNGSSLTFTNQLGQTSRGQFLSSGTQVFDGAPNNVVGTLLNGNTQIDWSDGTVWTLAPSGNVPSISGNWFINGRATTIAQNGASLTFTNENGQTASGQFLSSGTQVMAGGFNNLVGNLSNGNTEIDWTNGTVWTLAPSGNVPNIAGNWLINGQSANIVQNGASLSFTNQLGQTFAGQFLASGTQIRTGAPINLIGTLTNGNTQIDWSDGTIWTLAPTTTVPNIAGNWMINGQAATIVQNGSSLTFTNQLGQTFTGQFDASGTQFQTNGTNNLVGTLTNGNTQIDWSDGTVWTLAPTGTMPNIAGNWLINGQATTIVQSGSSLTFTNEHGKVALGEFLSTGGQVMANGFRNLVGNLTNGNTEIDWSNGTVWTLAPTVTVPSIAGNWTIDGQATTIVQNGASLTFTNERGQVALGEFLSTGGQVMANGWHNLIGTLANGNTQIDWSNGTVWNLA